MGAYVGRDFGILVTQWWFYAWAVFGAAITFVVYIAILTHFMRRAAFALGYDIEQVAIPWWERAAFHINHWRTVILIWIGVLAQLFSYVNGEELTVWSGLPWYSVFNERIAGTITITCVMLATLSHASQYANAASTTPVDK